MNRQKKACSLSGYQGRYAGKVYEGNLGEPTVSSINSYKVSRKGRDYRGSRMSPY